MPNTCNSSNYYRNYESNLTRNTLLTLHQTIYKTLLAVRLLKLCIILYIKLWGSATSQDHKDRKKQKQKIQRLRFQVVGKAPKDPISFLLFYSFFLFHRFALLNVKTYLLLGLVLLSGIAR